MGDDRTTSSARGRLFVLAAAVLWSLSGAITKRLDLGPMPIAFYRSFFAGLVLLPLIPPRRWAFRPAMVPACLAFGAMIGLYISAIKLTSAANAIFLQCTASLWLVPASALLLREPPDRRSLLGIAVAAPGVAAIVLFGHEGTPEEWVGIGYGLASGVAYASVVLGLRALRALDPTWLAAVNNLGGALVLAAWMLLISGSVPIASASQALALLVFGAVQMAIPYALFARGLQAVGAPEAGLIALLEPILNPVWVALFAHERPRPATIVGGLFLLAGVACRYLPRTNRRASSPIPGERLAFPRSDDLPVG